VNKQVQFGSLPGQIPPSDLRKIEEVIHQVAHVIRAVEYTVKIPLGFFGQLGGVLFFQDAGESINVAQRCAEIVRDRIAEGFQFLICGG